LLQEKKSQYVIKKSVEN